MWSNLSYHRGIPNSKLIRKVTESMHVTKVLNLSLRDHIEPRSQDLVKTLVAKIKSECRCQLGKWMIPKLPVSKCLGSRCMIEIPRRCITQVEDFGSKGQESIRTISFPLGTYPHDWQRRQPFFLNCCLLMNVYKILWVFCHIVGLG